jgi:hypothetical protein
MTGGMPRPEVSLWVHFSSIFDGFGLNSITQQRDLCGRACVRLGALGLLLRCDLVAVVVYFGCLCLARPSLAVKDVNLHLSCQRLGIEPVDHFHRGADVTGEGVQIVSIKKAKHDGRVTSALQRARCAMAVLLEVR